MKSFHSWAWRSCGIVCLEMILKNDKKTMDIIKEGLAKNEYIFKGDIGWKHKTLIEIVKENNLEASSSRFLITFDIAVNIQKKCM